MSGSSVRVNGKGGTGEEHDWISIFFFFLPSLLSIFRTLGFSLVFGLFFSFSHHLGAIVSDAVSAFGSCLV
jgi:hypothetical protein